MIRVEKTSPHNYIPGIGMCCPCLEPLCSLLFFESVKEVKASTIGFEKMVTSATPTIRKKRDLIAIFHLGSS